MEKDFDYLSVSQLCEFIDLLHPYMDDYLYVYDFIHDYYYISPDAVKRFALPSHSFQDVVANHKKFVYPADFYSLQEDLALLINGEKEDHNMQYRWLSITGEPIWINCRGCVVKKDGKPSHMIGCINEIGVRQKADNVSGLLGITSLQSFLSERAVTISHGYLMRLGLDDFKEINEKLGSDYGDMILRRTAECISSHITSSQMLFRAVADEFLLLDTQNDDIKSAISLYKSIRQTVDEFVEANHYEAVFTISGGILSYKDMHGHSFSDIMKLSEFSLNEAKRDGKNRYYIFQQAAYDKFLRRRRVTQLLRQSVNHDFEGFEAYLQPLFDATTNSLYGAEALMRFRTKEFGMVSPMEFIPLLEETGLIMPAGKWMLHKSLALCHEIQSARPGFQISINISYIQVMKSNIINEIISAVTAHGISPAHVIIELTESGMLESDSRVTKLVSNLKDNGIRLALDDFGTGYSNFSYLNELKPDIIKIDRSFTLKALENDYEYQLLSLMSNMVHSLNLKMCIEGIETTEDLNKMNELSPDYCQGYYFGKPCPYEEFKEQYLA